MSSSQGKVLASVSVGRLNLSLKSARKAQYMHAQDKKETITLSKDQLLAFASIGTPAATALLQKRTLDQIQKMSLQDISAINGMSYDVALQYLMSLNGMGVVTGSSFCPFGTIPNGFGACVPDTE